jgi:predicted nucleic acid-binding protein
LFIEVTIPRAVYDEVVINRKGEAGSEETEAAIKEGWILRKSVSDKTAVSALI